MVLSKEMRRMAMNTAPPGLREKISFYRKALWAIFFRLPFIVIRTIFRDRKKTRSYLHALRNGILRAVLASMTVREFKTTLPASTLDSLRINCKKMKVPLETEYLKHDAMVHWMGDRKAEKIILYMHGGGFGLPAMDGHVMFLQKCVVELKKKGISAVVAWADYGLTPNTRYPETFKRCVEVLRHLLEAGHKPSNIIIGGDSAGGNATLAILSHIVHPHPSIEPLLLNPTDRLGGALLICPWVGLVPTCPSVTSNKQKDVIFHSHLECWRAMFVDEDKLDNYAQPLEAPAEWWEDIPVSKVMVIGGGDELFIDDIVDIGKKIREKSEKKGVETEIVVAEKEVHVECMFDAQTMLPIGKIGTASWEWMAKVWV